MHINLLSEDDTQAGIEGDAVRKEKQVGECRLLSLCKTGLCWSWGLESWLGLFCLCADDQLFSAENKKSDRSKQSWQQTSKLLLKDWFFKAQTVCNLWPNSQSSGGFFPIHITLKDLQCRVCQAYMQQCRFFGIILILHWDGYWWEFIDTDSPREFFVYKQYLCRFSASATLYWVYK